MARLYRDHPAALARTQEIAARCGFCLDELSYDYPDEVARARNRRPGSTGWRGRGSSSATRMARRAGCTT